MNATRRAGRGFVLACLMVLLGLAIGAPVTAAPGVDSAVGAGQLADGGRFQFNAKGSLTNVKGHVRYDNILFDGNPWADSKGTVECLYVSGNVATISGTFDDPANTVLPYFLLVVIDKGKGQVDEAKVIATPTPASVEFDCGYERVKDFGTEIGAKVNAKVKDR